MRPNIRTVLLLAALPLSSSTAFAASAPEDAFELSALAAPGGSYSDYEGFELDTGFGLAAGWRFAPRWGAEVRALRQDGRVAEAETYQVGVRFSAEGGPGDWRPFAVGGLHLQRSDLRHDVVCVQAPCPPLHETHDDLGAFVGGGVDWIVSRPLIVRFEGRLAGYDSDRRSQSETTSHFTAGVVWRF